MISSLPAPYPVGLAGSHHLEGFSETPFRQALCGSGSCDPFPEAAFEAIPVADLTAMGGYGRDFAVKGGRDVHVVVGAGTVEQLGLALTVHASRPSASYSRGSAKRFPASG